MHISHPIHFLIHLWIKYATGINTAFNVKKIKYINKTIYKISLLSVLKPVINPHTSKSLRNVQFANKKKINYISLPFTRFTFIHIRLYLPSI